MYKGAKFLKTIFHIHLVNHVLSIWMSMNQYSVFFVCIFSCKINKSRITRRHRHTGIVPFSWFLLRNTLTVPCAGVWSTQCACPVWGTATPAPAPSSQDGAGHHFLRNYSAWVFIALNYQSRQNRNVVNMDISWMLQVKLKILQVWFFWNLKQAFTVQLSVFMAF
jgi:hypothetical protein